MWFFNKCIRKQTKCPADSRVADRLADIESPSALSIETSLRCPGYRFPIRILPGEVVQTLPPLSSLGLPRPVAVIVPTHAFPRLNVGVGARGR